MQEGDLVLCTVREIEKTAVFVELPTGEKGTIVLSEIAAGRIKNMREYAVPNKKIVCKILRLSNGNIELSLRRVSSKEQKEIMDKYKQEQTSISALRSILKEEYEKISSEILKKYSNLFDFLVEARENESLVEKYVPKSLQEQVKKLTEKKKKFVEVKKILKIKCLHSDGLSRVKKILDIKDETISIVYIAAGEFQLTFKGEDYKSLNRKIQTLLEDLEKKAKKDSCEFSVEEKK
jgi:translation initiation factor 2 alpha subunit (eIF-2alpha)